ncbi:hypothetical protein C1141_19670, partial [Vibrio agarivorans]
SPDFTDVAFVLSDHKGGFTSGILRLVNVDLISIPICGGVLNASIPNDVNAICLKVATVNASLNDINSNWFSHPPSYDLMDYLNYTVSNTANNSGDTYVLSRSGRSSFAQFRQDGSDFGQFNRWCKKLASLNFAGRNNWRRPTYQELLAFFSSRNLNEIGWLFNDGYWTSDFNSPNFLTLGYLKDVYYRLPSIPDYGSCVAVPER